MQKFFALAPASVSVILCFGCGSSTPTTAGNAANGGAAASMSTTTSMSSSGGRTSATQASTPPKTTTTPPTAASGGPSSTGSGGSPARAGSPAPATTSGAGHPAASGGSGGVVATAAGSGGQKAAAGSGGSAAAAGMGGSGAAAAGDSSITGTLGALGPVMPIMNGWATTNGLETLIYLSTAPLTCEMMMTRGVKWLSKLPAGSQVLEVVVGTPAAAKTYNLGTAAALGGGEVNYAEGSKSSSTEVTGKTGSITLTTATASGVHEGMIDVSAPFMAKGKFHAEWCEGGTEY